jgi:2-keto-4-pentenoate hydratase/2-oxohepta-3-ene-1,7-dioic acid hydratase in catechol pathway
MPAAVIANPREPLLKEVGAVPTPRSDLFLKSGDVMEVDVEGLGVLRDPAA